MGGNVTIRALKYPNTPHYQWDVDLDYVQRSPHEKWQVLDQDEFVVNAETYGYPDRLIECAERGLQDLQRRVNEGLFPFDGTLQSYLRHVVGPN